MIDVKILATARERIEDVLSRVAREPCLLDPDGRLSEVQERRINAQLAPHGMRVARDRCGGRQNLLDETTLHIEPIRRCKACSHAGAEDI